MTVFLQVFCSRNTQRGSRQHVNNGRVYFQLLGGPQDKHTVFSGMPDLEHISLHSKNSQLDWRSHHSSIRYLLHWRALYFGSSENRTVSPDEGQQKTRPNNSLSAQEADSLSCCRKTMFSEKELKVYQILSIKSCINKSWETIVFDSWNNLFHMTRTFFGNRQIHKGKFSVFFHSTAGSSYCLSISNA